jgi:hypothetical protein
LSKNIHTLSFFWNERWWNCGLHNTRYPRHKKAPKRIKNSISKFLGFAAIRGVKECGLFEIEVNSSTQICKTQNLSIADATIRESTNNVNKTGLFVSAIDDDRESRFLPKKEH